MQLELEPGMIVMVVQAEALDGCPAEAAVDIVMHQLLPTPWTHCWRLTGERVVPSGL